MIGFDSSIDTKYGLYLLICYPKNITNSSDADSKIPRECQEIWNSVTWIDRMTAYYATKSHKKWLVSGWSITTYSWELTFENLDSESNHCVEVQFFPIIHVIFSFAMRAQTGKLLLKILTLKENRMGISNIILLKEKVWESKLIFGL